MLYPLSYERRRPRAYTTAIRCDRPILEAGSATTTPTKPTNGAETGEGVVVGDGEVDGHSEIGRSGGDELEVLEHEDAGPGMVEAAKAGLAAGHIVAGPPGCDHPIGPADPNSRQ